MPFGSNDWLALTPEPTLEPDLPIIDPHHHFWDYKMERMPYQRYLLPELLGDISSGHNIVATVFVEARAMYRANAPEEMRPVGEIEFAQGLAAASASGLYGPCRVADGIVAHANLNLGEDVGRVLDRLEAASPNRFRGIRHSVTWDDDPSVPNSALYKIPHQMMSDSYRAGARVLASRGLTMESWMYSAQLPELASLARAVPDLTIISDHIGGLMRIGPYAARSEEVVSTWKRDIATVAECPNVYMKLGGMGMINNGFDWHTRDKPVGSEEAAKEMAPFMHYCIEKFGPERCMFESNFPVDKWSFSYNVVFNAFKRLSKEYSPTERQAMFHDTAAKVYRLPSGV